VQALRQDTSKVDELEKQLSRIKEQLKGAEREQQELKSEVDKLSAQVAEIEADPQKKIANDPPIVSEAGIDYSRLQNFLAAGEWEKANFETVAIINTLLYEIAEKYTDDEKDMDFYRNHRSGAYSKFITMYIYEEYEEYEKYICFSKNSRRKFRKFFHKLQGNDLDIIDRLWLKYSYGRFGFSVQKRLYELLKGDMIALTEALNWGWWYKDDDNYYKGEERYNSSEKEYSINAPVGHLPIVYVRSGGDIDMILSLHSLLENIQF
jgi:DNA repair exonuclease SbcCD ATPase subunit